MIVRRWALAMGGSFDRGLSAWSRGGIALAARARRSLPVCLGARPVEAAVPSQWSRPCRPIDWVSSHYTVGDLQTTATALGPSMNNSSPTG